MKRITLSTWVVFLALSLGSCHFFKDENLLGSWKTIDTSNGIKIETVLSFELVKATAEGEKDTRTYTRKVSHDGVEKEETQGTWEASAEWLKGGVEKVTLTMGQDASGEEEGGEDPGDGGEEPEEEPSAGGASTYFAQLSNESAVLILVWEVDGVNYKEIYQKIGEASGGSNE